MWPWEASQPEIRHRRCTACEVGWHTAHPYCWHCGKQGELGDVLSLRPKERLTPIPARHHEWTAQDNAALLSADMETA